MAEEKWSCDERRVVSSHWDLVLDQAGSMWLLSTEMSSGFLLILPEWSLTFSLSDNRNREPRDEPGVRPGIFDYK